MLTRTFLDKTTTIKRDTLENFGLHPISMLGYGGGVYRSLLHFDIKKLKSLVNDCTYPDLDKLSHHLLMRNCGDVDAHAFFAKQSTPEMPGIKNRATSFDVILFKVNKHWDEGIGFDNQYDFWDTGKGVVSEDGATWYHSSTEELWDEDGIYSEDYIESQYEAYLNWLKDKNGENPTIIVGMQHFDHGNENLNIDITDYVNELLEYDDTECIEYNYGLCLAFIPELEVMERKQTQYVGFFNNKTNTIFEPVVESRYAEIISDDRMTFYLNKVNKLYLYCYIAGKLQNLDVLPECVINGNNYPVQQEGRGIYSVSVFFNSNLCSKDTVLYDEWTNLKYNGVELDSVELEFVTHSSSVFFAISDEVSKPRVLNPIVVGINSNEKLNKGEERVIKLYFKQPYTKSDFYLVDSCQYRIYVKDGEREITIVDWDNINKMNKCNLFTIKSDELVPAQYHVDIKAMFGDTVKIYKDELNFTVVSDATKMRL